MNYGKTKDKMEYNKFESDFLQVTLHAIVFDGSIQKEVSKTFKKIHKVVGDHNISRQDLIDSRGYTISNRFDQQMILINIDKGMHEQYGAYSILKTLHHECNHFMWNELQCISSTPTYHNEFEMRLSDWAFLKITSMDYFQGLLKKKSQTTGAV